MRSLLLRASALILVGMLAPACTTSDGGATQQAEEGGSGTDSSLPVTPNTDAAPPPSTDAGAKDAAPEGPSCTNKKKDGSETDIDCGGSCPTRCKALAACAVPADCATDLVCVKKVCSSPAANDGLKDGDETDVDCGGKSAPPCDVAKGCKVALDCVEKVCGGATCLAPTDTDGVKNGSETDTDCGGGTAPACADGKKCVQATRDCTSKVCTGGACIPPAPNDGVKNANETDIDCGGGAPAPACGTGKTCLVGASDCDSLVCNVTCQAATGTDGVKNGNESDIDCGGTNTGAPKCDAGLKCNGHSDCAKDGCAYDGTCAVERSCTKNLGGDTCGVGEIGQGGAVHQSCCTTAPLAGSAVRIDKFHVTAGRMRAFVERNGGDLRTFAAASPGWNATWSPYVPHTLAEANEFLGSFWVGAPNDGDAATNNWSKRSCHPNGFGGHTYWVPPNGAEVQSSFTQNQMDPKALNCVGWHMAAAFCAWDHGRLPTRAEIVNAFKNGNTTTWPWQPRDNSAYSASVQDARVNHIFNYGYPGAEPKIGGTTKDIAWFISPPGRFTEGRNANGVEDIMGNLLHWDSDAEYNFTWTASWENHAANLGGQNWKQAWTGEPNGYYGIGFRCVHD